MPTFTHKQRATVRTSGEAVTVLATKRDLRPMGFWLVRFADGGCLCVHETNLVSA